MEENLILIFTRNPELGKVKTRLAASIGDNNALEVYKILLHQTQKAIFTIEASKRVLYADDINTDDIWDNEIYQKGIQFGQDLGTRMKNAFVDAFNDDFKKIVIIGTDLYDLKASDIEIAFKKLEDHDVVIGPALDGGYYLLGLKFIPEGIFYNKNWSTNTVLKDTLKNLLKYTVYQLEIKNDIDTIEDIQDIAIFQKYIRDDN
jgi:uncharacterized protein